MKSRKTRALTIRSREYDAMLSRVVSLIDEARRVSARTVNAIMTGTYWLIGRHIVEFEQGGKSKTKYGEEVIDQIASDLTARFGRGFTGSNLFNMRAFYLANRGIVQTVSGQSLPAVKIRTTSGKSRRKAQTVSAQLTAPKFLLPWSAYVRPLSLKDEQARKFYEAELIWRSS